MRGNIKKALVLFMVGMLVMQVLFSDASKSVFADHSESGTITYVNGVRVVKEANTNVLSTCFCISQTKFVRENDTVTSNMTLEPDKAYLLNNAILLGFNVKGEALQSITPEQKNAYANTQKVVWDIIESRFNGTASDLHKKVDFTQKAPSYVTQDENVLKWNAATSKFELVLTNTVVEGELSANTYVKVDQTTLPTGVTAEVNGETIKFTSTEEFTDVKSIKIYKQVGESGQLVAWDNGAGTKQPQISLDYGAKPLVKTFDLKIKTDKKPVVATPAPTQAPTQDPAQKPTQDPAQKPTQDPAAQKPVEEKSVKVETKNVVDAAQALDDAPKTADETNLALAYKLIGASFFTMISLFVISLVQKRRNRL